MSPCLYSPISLVLYLKNHPLPHFTNTTAFSTAPCLFQKKKWDAELLKIPHISNTSFCSSTSHSASTAGLNTAALTALTIPALLQHQPADFALCGLHSVISWRGQQRGEMRIFHVLEPSDPRSYQTAHLHCNILFVDGTEIITDALQRVWPQCQINTFYSILSNFHVGFTTPFT